MKTWDEVKDGMTVYIRDSIEYGDENNIMHNTKPMQKACIDLSLEDRNVCTPIIIDGGEDDGVDLYFYHKDSQPSDLLTRKEYKEFITKPFEIVNGEKICPKCKEHIIPKMKMAWDGNWCPYCGYNMPI